MTIVFKLAAALFVAAALSLSLKKEQPAFAFLVSVCAAVGVLAVVLQRLEPIVTWMSTANTYLQGENAACLLRVMGIAVAAQLAADTCREAGMNASASSVELCGRVLALLQALPMLEGLLDSLSSYLQ